jgi:aspartyl-tRNA(Asn)/glutamyl-tRNA(Gln) amidotransferase subunit C
MRGLYDRFLKMNIDHLARLARLALTDKEKQIFEEQLQRVMGYFSLIQTVPTESLQPLVTPTPIDQVLRADRAELWEGREDATSNAAEVIGHLFKVPPVL